MKKKNILNKFILCLSIIGICGCDVYNCKPAKMNKITGTYKLSTYSISEAVVNSEDNSTDHKEAIDAIKEYDITCYLVITGNETGYYYYSDSKTEGNIVEIGLTYEYETEEGKEDEVRYVSYTNDNGIEIVNDYYYPNGSKEKLAVFHGFFNKNLNRTTTIKKQLTLLNKTYPKDSKISVKYKRVSRDTTTNYINKKI